MIRFIGVVSSVAVAASLGLAWHLLRDKAPGPTGRADELPIVVTLANPVSKPFRHEVEALGTVRANESIDITAKVADRVAAIRFIEGQDVTRGEVLIELASDEVQAELAAAVAAEHDSLRQFGRGQELRETYALSEAQLDQLKATKLANEARVAAARSRLNDRFIRAPFSGRIGLRNVSLGGLVSPGMVITTLDDLRVVKLDFSVPEVFLASLKPGLVVNAKTNVYPQEGFEGKVGSINPRVDPTTRSVIVRAVLDNEDGRLRPGMFMTLHLVTADSEALMVPEQAIVPEQEHHFVFVVDGNRAHKRPVKLGRRRPGEVEIVEGVSPQDQIVVNGVLNVREGALVRAEELAIADVPST